jgi:hypothetical protein
MLSGASVVLSGPAAGISATKKAGRWPTLFCGSIPSNLGIGREYSHPTSKRKAIALLKPEHTRNIYHVTQFILWTCGTL